MSLTAANQLRPAQSPYPGKLSLSLFALKSTALKARRALFDSFEKLPRLEKGAVTEYPIVLAESNSPLRTEIDPREKPLLLGKIQNLNLACRQIHHRLLPAGQIFSFWRQVGPPWRVRGFTIGREVREGCVIPTVGGGLCQLSGSLLEVALTLDLELIEKHCHTALPADVLPDAKRDATLFWNYVDLRFRTQIPLLFESYLTDDSLIVRLRGKTAVPITRRKPNWDAIPVDPPTRVRAEGCFTCDQFECSRHAQSRSAKKPMGWLRPWKRS